MLMLLLLLGFFMHSHQNEFIQLRQREFIHALHATTAVGSRMNLLHKQVLYRQAVQKRSLRVQNLGAAVGAPPWWVGRDSVHALAVVDIDFALAEASPPSREGPGLKWTPRLCAQDFAPERGALLPGVQNGTYIYTYVYIYLVCMQTYIYIYIHIYICVLTIYICMWCVYICWIFFC